MDTKIKSTVLFTIAQKGEKYWGIIPTTHTGFVYWKLHNADKINQRISKLTENKPCSWIGRVSIVRVSVLPQTDVQFLSKSQTFL